MRESDIGFSLAGAGLLLAEHNMNFRVRISTQTHQETDVLRVFGPSNEPLLMKEIGWVIPCDYMD